MAYLTLQTFQFPNWRAGGSTGYLRIFASQGFYEATTGAFIPQGTVGNLQSACQVYNTTISGSTVTIPEVVLATTTDSTVPTALYTAVLYTSANRPVYTLLANFFVDPEYLASSAQSSVLIASAGLASIDGNYTYRGQTGGYNYYNLEGESDSTTAMVVKNNGSLWLVTDSLAATKYTSLAQTTNPWDGLWQNAGGGLPAPTVSENTEAISGTWEQLTLTNQAYGTPGGPFQFQSPFWDVQQTKEWTLSLIGANGGDTPYASRTVIGKSELSTDPVSASNPIAVGDNDARVNTVNAAQYSTFSAAVDAVAALSGTNILEITTSISSGTKSIPADVIVQFANGGKITATSGTITILGEIRAPAQLCFVESGGVFDIDSARADTFYFEWYGITSGSDNTTALQKMITQRKGGNYEYATTIQLVQGVDYSHSSPLNWNNVFGMTVNGPGGGQYLMNGFTYTGSGSSTAHTMKANTGCKFNSVAFEYSHASFTGYFIEGGYSPGDTGLLRFENCRIAGTTTAYSAKALVCFNGTIISGLRNTAFQYGQIGYQGVALLSETPQQSVVNYLDGCTFNDCGIHIYNAGESLSVTNCTHEATTRTGDAGGGFGLHSVANGVGADYRRGDLRIYGSDGTSTFALTMNGFWAGDCTASASTYATFDFNAVYGANISGGFVDGVDNSGSGGATTLVKFNACEEIEFGSGLFASNFNNAVTFDTGTSNGVKLMGRLGATTFAPQYTNGGQCTRLVRLGSRTYDNSIGSGLTVEGVRGAFADNQALQLGLVTTNGTQTTDARIGVAFGLAAIANNDLAIVAPYNAAERAISFATYTGTSFVERLKILAAGITAKAHLLFGTDNTYDIGASGATRPRTGYFGTSVVVPTLTASSAIAPAANDGAALGDATHNFSDLFLASGALINIANSNWVATHSSGILTVSTGDFRVTTAGTNSASVVTVGGTQTLTAKTLTNPTVTTGAFTSPAITTPTINSGAALGATSTEIDQLNDVSAYTETITAAGAMSVTKVVTKLAVVGGGAVTLAVPSATMYGQLKTIEMTTDDGNVTFALTNVVGQSSGTTATFDAVGDALILMAAFDKWIVVKEYGVTLT